MDILWPRWVARIGVTRATEACFLTADRQCTELPLLRLPPLRYGTRLRSTPSGSCWRAGGSRGEARLECIRVRSRQTRHRRWVSAWVRMACLTSSAAARASPPPSPSPARATPSSHLSCGARGSGSFTRRATTRRLTPSAARPFERSCLEVRPMTSAASRHDPGLASTLPPHVPLLAAGAPALRAQRTAAAAAARAAAACTRAEVQVEHRL